MDRRLNKRVVDYMDEIKNEIHQEHIKLNNIGRSIDIKDIDKILNIFYDYPPFVVDKRDFEKRRRAKNVVPYYDRCIATRATGEQCTRRKQENDTFCGTHIKGTPHGVYDYSNVSDPDHNNTSIWTEDINGIIHYVDGCGNVYKTEDILNNVRPISVMCKYLKDSNDEYKLIM
jgi:hypothetical protein